MRTNCHGSDGFRTVTLPVKLEQRERGRERERERERAFHAPTTLSIMPELKR